jgi:outer membrane protein
MQTRQSFPVLNRNEVFSFSNRAAVLMPFSQKFLIAAALSLTLASASLAQSTDQASEGPAYQADTLQSVLASVYTSNPQLLIERARLREIDENYVQARAAGRPQLSLGASITRQATRGPDDNPSPFNPDAGNWVSVTPRAAQVDVLQPLYQGGRVKALKQQAKAGILAARAGLEGAENSVFLAAASAYVDVLRDEEAARIRRNNVRVLDRQLEAADARFEVGEGTRTDIAQSQSRLAAAEAGLAQADAQLEVSRARFVRLVGRMPDRLSPVPEIVLPQTLDRARALARENSPQILAAYFNELAGEAAIDVAKAAGRPSLSLQGSIARQRGSFLGFSDADQALVGAQLSVPIFSGGANESRVRQAKHARTRLGFETRDAERALDETITQVWAQLDASQRILATSRLQVEAAETAFEGVQLERDVGIRTQLDVLDAEQETLNAQLSLLQAQRNLDVAAFQLLATIGVFDTDGLSLAVDAYDPDDNLEDVLDDDFKRFADKVVPDQIRADEPSDLDLQLLKPARDEEPITVVAPDLPTDETQ